MSILDGRFFVGGEIGSGAYGVVCRGVDIKSENKRHVAVKTVDLDLLPKERRAFAATTVDAEMKIMQTLDHPNVLRAITVIVCDQRRHLVLELCRGPSVQQVLDARGALQEDEARDVLRQCLGALRHLHGRSIIHRDVKPANIMFVEPFIDEKAPRKAQKTAVRTSSLCGQQVKLIDFGLGRVLPHAYKAAKRDGSKHNGSEHGARALADTSKHKGVAWTPATVAGSSKHGNSRHGGNLKGLAGLGGLGSRNSSSPPVRRPSNTRGGDTPAAEPPPAGPPLGARKGGGLRALGQDISPGGSRHGGSKHGVSMFVGGSKEGSKHGDSKHGGSKHGGSGSGSAKIGGGRGAAVEDSVYNFGWLSHLEERFEVSAHGSQMFAPPEMQATWREHFGSANAPPPGTMGTLRGLTTRDAWMLDVFALGLMLRYMLTGIEPTADGKPPHPHPVGEVDDECFACCTPREPPFERLLRGAAELPELPAALIDRMTEAEARNRLDIQQCLDHPWMAGGAAAHSPGAAPVAAPSEALGRITQSPNQLPTGARVPSPGLETHMIMMPSPLLEPSPAASDGPSHA